MSISKNIKRLWKFARREEAFDRRYDVSLRSFARALASSDGMTALQWMMNKRMTR